MRLDSVNLAPGQRIPEQHTKDGEDLSPPLKWGSVPDGTASFALICEDPDAPRGTFAHWVIFDISPDVRELPEGLPREAQLSNGALQGRNDFGDLGYSGPKPPRGDEHTYHFRLFALDTRLELDPGASRQEVLDEMEGHVLDEVDLTGTYSRPVSA